MTDFDALLARTDPDRRLAALFAPPQVRGRLFALYAFYQEIARIPDAVSEPMIGEMRLQWAREAVEDLYADPPRVRRHDIYEALSELRHAPGAPDKAALLEIVEARSADLGAGPFPTRQDRLDYVDRTAVAVMRAAVGLAKPDIDLTGEAGAAVHAAGRLWGFAGLVRALPRLAKNAARAEQRRAVSHAVEVAHDEARDVDAEVGRERGVEGERRRRRIVRARASALAVSHRVRARGSEGAVVPRGRSKRRLSHTGGARFWVVSNF